MAPDRRTQPPRRAHIGLVRAAVSIPVMGNGDVFTPEDCAGLLDDTGCDGVSLGRIAVARPWVFAAWTGVLVGGPDDDPARNPAPWREAPLALLDALARRHGPARAVRMFGKFLVYITANYTYGNGLRGRLLRVMGQTPAPPALDDPGGLRALQDALRAELDPLPAVLRRPSALLFGM